jgi:hypothetical protein
MADGLDDQEAMELIVKYNSRSLNDKNKTKLLFDYGSFVLSVLYRK